MRTENIDCPFIHDAVQYQEIHSKQTKRAYGDLVFGLRVKELAR